MLTWAFQLYAEVSQVVGTISQKKYILSFWNLNDLIHLLGVLELLLYSQFLENDIDFGL